MAAPSPDTARSLVPAVIGIAASAAIATAALGLDGVDPREPMVIAIAAVLGLGALAFARAPAAIRSPAVGLALGALRDRIGQVIRRAQETRRAAEDTQRDKEEFLAAVSHELRTPLNSIQGFAQVLLSEIDGPLTDSQREDVEAIQQAGAYLKELVDEVIDASSRRTPAVARVEMVDVAELVREVARMIEPQRGSKSIAIEIDVAPELPRLPGDPRRLRQILVNLGSNALKYTRAGQVRFSARLDHKAMRISVADTGPGIAPADRERVFRAYERVDTNRGRTEGWGLGLAIALEMAQWHGGTIELESTVGVGSTFTLVLPVGART